MYPLVVILIDNIKEIIRLVSTFLTPIDYPETAVIIGVWKCFERGLVL